VDRQHVAIVGGGSWGTALAIVAARAGRDVTLLLRGEERARLLATTRRNHRYLPAATLPERVAVTADPATACRESALIVLVVPSQTMRENARLIAPLVGEAIVVSAAKGLERGSLLRMTSVVREEVPGAATRVCALSGPNLAAEVAAGQPATTVIAGQPAAAERVRHLLTSDRFRCYTNEDVIGVEMGGALKNVVAIGAGIGDGLGAGDNAKAAFVTRGLAEIARLGIAVGANPLTFAGLAGLGDLIATCSSPLSRNRRVGVALAQGQSLAQITAGLGQVAEGIETTAVARELAGRVGVELPIADQLYQVLFHGKSPEQAIADLMRRETKDELAGLGRGGASRSSKGEEAGRGPRR
jgi:glycerol-3-phosphate dehydrogenase (NAD(P)+)